MDSSSPFPPIPQHGEEALNSPRGLTSEIIHHARAGRHDAPARVPARQLARVPVVEGLVRRRGRGADGGAHLGHLDRGVVVHAEGVGGEGGRGLGLGAWAAAVGAGVALVRGGVVGCAGRHFERDVCVCVCFVELEV